VSISSAINKASVSNPRRPDNLDKIIGKMYYTNGVRPINSPREESIIMITEFRVVVATRISFLLFFLIVPARFSSADWSEDIDREIKRSQPLVIIDAEVQSALKSLTAISKKYYAFAREVGPITPMNYISVCTKLRNFPLGQDIAEIQSQATRVNKLIQDARDLEDRGRISPRRLREILSNGELSRIMNEIILYIKELQVNCGM